MGTQEELLTVKRKTGRSAANKARGKITKHCEIDMQDADTEESESEEPETEESECEARSSMEEEEYVVGAILDERVNEEDGSKECLVQWRDYPDEKWNTWEPQKGVSHTEAYEIWTQRKKQRKKAGKPRLRSK